MPLPQRLNFVTLGAWSMSAMREFCSRWGWIENDGATDDYVSFRVGSVVLAIFPIDRLVEEAAPGTPTPDRGAWSGVTFAINFSSRPEVDRAISAAVAAGGTPVAEPVDREWGGYSGYVADPEGAIDGISLGLQASTQSDELTHRRAVALSRGTLPELPIPFAGRRGVPSFDATSAPALASPQVAERTLASRFRSGTEVRHRTSYTSKSSFAASEDNVPLAIA